MKRLFFSLLLILSAAGCASSDTRSTPPDIEYVPREYSRLVILSNNSYFAKALNSKLSSFESSVTYLNFKDYTAIRHASTTDKFFGNLNSQTKKMFTGDPDALYLFIDIQQNYLVQIKKDENSFKYHSDGECYYRKPAMFSNLFDVGEDQEYRVKNTFYIYFYAVDSTYQDIIWQGEIDGIRARYGDYDYNSESLTNAASIMSALIENRGILNNQ